LGVRRPAPYSSSPWQRSTDPTSSGLSNDASTAIRKEEKLLQMSQDKRKTVALIIPHPRELAPLIPLLPPLKHQRWEPVETYITDLGSLRLVVIVPFVGLVNAALAAANALNFGPSYILHGGSAGAINPALLPGDIVLAAEYKMLAAPEVLAARQSLSLPDSPIRFRRHRQDLHPGTLTSDPAALLLGLSAAQSVVDNLGMWAGPGWPESIPKVAPAIHSGVVASADHWTRDVDRLRFFHQQFGADSEDMESAAIAQVAAIYEVPLLTVRCISNNEYLGALTSDQIPQAISCAAAQVAAVLKAVLLKLQEI